MISKSKIIVRYAETDQMGMVHHANYPVWYEVARTDLIKKIGFSYTSMEQQGIYVPLIELGCRYKKPAFYEEELIIEAKAVSLNPVKITFEYIVSREKDQEILNTGFTVHGWTGKDRSPLSLKKQFPEIYHLIQEALE